MISIVSPVSGSTRMRPAFPLSASASVLLLPKPRTRLLSRSTITARIPSIPSLSTTGCSPAAIDPQQARRVRIREEDAAAPVARDRFEHALVGGDHARGRLRRAVRRSVCRRRGDERDAEQNDARPTQEHDSVHALRRLVKNLYGRPTSPFV